VIADVIVRRFQVVAVAPPVPDKAQAPVPQVLPDPQPAPEQMRDVVS